MKFDVTLGESFYNPWLKDVVQQLRDRGIAQQSEGAWCVFSDGTLPPKEDPFLIQRDGEWSPMPALVQKTDGAANYTTTDLATLEYRLKTWSPDEILYLTGGPQQLHFRQLFAIFRRWHPEVNVRLAHVWFGSIMGEDGKPFKTRSGESIALAALLDEAGERAYKIVAEKNPEMPETERREIARIIGIGAVKYADLVPNRQSDYVFSWDKMLRCRATPRRICRTPTCASRAIFRKLNAGFEPPAKFTLSAPAESLLAKKLFQLAKSSRWCWRITVRISSQLSLRTGEYFPQFLRSVSRIEIRGTARSTRLALCDLTARVLQQGLQLLGIQVPSRM